MATGSVWNDLEKTASSAGWLQPEAKPWTWPAAALDTEVAHENRFLVPGTLLGSNPTTHCCLPIPRSRAALEGML